MCDFEELIFMRNFELLESNLLKHLEQNPNDVEILMNLALTKLKFPFNDEVKCLEYLCRIISIDPNNFKAIAIKIYCENHYCCQVDELNLKQLFSIGFDNAEKTAIAYFIKSWIYSPLHIKCNEDMEKKYLLKSTEIFPYTVHPFKRLGKIFEGDGQLEVAKEYFQKALSNVRCVLTGGGSYITPQPFIDEYITGISLSSANYDALRRLI